MNFIIWIYLLVASVFVSREFAQFCRNRPTTYFLFLMNMCDITCVVLLDPSFTFSECVLCLTTCSEVHRRLFSSLTLSSNGPMIHYSLIPYK